MDAKIYNMAQWKAAHPPALAVLNSALAFTVAWQQMWLKVLCGPSK